MIDLDELRIVLEDAQGWFVRRDAWGTPCLWYRSSLSGEPHVVRDLDDRSGGDRLIMWAFAHLNGVLTELEAREVAST